MLPVILLFLASSSIISTKKYKIAKGYRTSWNVYKSYHGLQFDTEENLMREKIFQSNLEFIRDFNRNNVHMTLKMNHLGHLTDEEFKNLYLSTNISVKRSILPKGTLNTLQKTVDWRTKGVVNEVKDQKKCGSCWAFSTIGSLESIYAIKHKHLRSFSEQDLVDCSRSYGNHGCNGGYMENAFKYIKEKGITNEKDYVYTAKDGMCQHNKFKPAANISRYVSLPLGDEDQLTTSIQTIGPISVAIDAGSKKFRFYKRGIYYNEECNPFFLNHGVVAVGVSQKYYIVRNSWSNQWGNKGYIKMSRGRDNNCGIATSASYPVLA